MTFFTVHIFTPKSPISHLTPPELKLIRSQQWRISQSLSAPTKTPNLSSSTHFPKHFLTSRFTHLSISKPPKPAIIHMGGGPRTYPSGVSKWQRKQMEAKMAKQLLRARLSRECQMYEMRKRAELKAAIFELERPCEVMEKASWMTFRSSKKIGRIPVGEKMKKEVEEEWGTMRTRKKRKKIKNY